MNVIRAGYDVVIVNADSLDKSADAISFAKYSDEEILVATTDHTKNAELREAVASLAQVKAKEVNVVLFETK
jgi:Mrp family chromosome partitioning ATPase